MNRKQYCGFRVKLRSSQIGVVVGTVSKVTEGKIELTNATINELGTAIPFLAVENQFIQELSILATGSGDSIDTAEQKSAVDDFGRSQRREKLRSIPNTFNAYVCPDSPPVVRRSTGVPGNLGKPDASPGQKTAFNLIQLESSLADSHLSEKRKDTVSSKIRYGKRNNRRSFSLSEPAASSDFSGTESDSFSRPQPSSQRAPYQQPGRFHNRANVRPGTGSNKPHSKIDWDQVRVEDFIDQEFDFEKNLALFDKSAFYEMVDMRNGVSPKAGPTAPYRARSPKPLDEGPTGIGSPLIGTMRHSERLPTSKDYNDDCTMTTNTATLSSSRQRHEHAVPYYHPSSQPSSVSDNTNVFSGSASACISHSTQSSSTLRSWYTSSGLRVPVLPEEEHARMLHYLATGKDLSHAEHLSSFSGFTWGRLLETAGRSFMDFIYAQLKHISNTPQRNTKKLPARILIIPGKEDIAGAFALNLARLFAVRGASVVLFRAPADLHPSDQPAYLSELALCLQLSPRANSYGGVIEQDPFAIPADIDEDDEDEDDEVAQISDGAQTLQRESSNLLSFSDADSDLTASLTVDQMSSSNLDVSDASPLYRTWVSRTPGLKIIKRSSALTKLPRNLRIDLVILGHCTTDHVILNQEAHQWLKSHTAISRVAHLMPDPQTGSPPLLSNALLNWVIEFGLPKLPPDATDSAFNTTHLLVDVGMSRHALLRLTSDLKFLPPFNLFECGSVIGLRQNQTPCT